MDTLLDTETLLDSSLDESPYSLHGEPTMPEAKRQKTSAADTIVEKCSWVTLVVDALGAVLPRLQSALAFRIQTGCSGTGAPVVGLKA
eukprot:1200841-Amphidinium_carterae.2